jgi:hypothetical protein
VMLSKLRREPDGRKDKKGKKRTKVKGKNENFLWSWIGQRPREKRRQQLDLEEKQAGGM